MSFCFLINCFFPQFFFIFLSKTKQKAANSNSTVFEFHLFLSWFLVFHQSWKHPAERKETSSERRKDVSVGRSGWNMISDTPQTHTHTHTSIHAHTCTHAHTHTQRHTHTLCFCYWKWLFTEHTIKNKPEPSVIKTQFTTSFDVLSHQCLFHQTTQFSVFFFYMFLF